jgi:hypothetical protein
MTFPALVIPPSAPAACPYRARGPSTIPESPAGTGVASAPHHMPDVSQQKIWKSFSGCGKIVRGASAHGLRACPGARSRQWQIHPNEQAILGRDSGTMAKDVILIGEVVTRLFCPCRTRAGSSLPVAPLFPVQGSCSARGAKSNRPVCVGGGTDRDRHLHRRLEVRSCCVCEDDSGCAAR